MMIEGSRTGEEKIVTAVERRESVAVKPSTPLDSGGPSKENNPTAARDILRVKKLESEIKKLQELVKRRTQEKDDACRKATDFEELLASSSCRWSEREAELQRDAQEQQRQMELLRQTCKSLERQLTALIAEQEQVTAGSKSANDRHAAELQSSKADWERARLQLLTEMEATKMELKQQREASAALERRVATLCNEATLREGRFEKDLNAAKIELTKLLTESDALRHDIRTRDATMEDWRTRIDQCRHYIVKICQPQFSVVKDDTLTPVQPGGAEPGGFVLVPLQLMLEGYTLLPPDLKKKIAEQYESSKKLKM